MTDIPLLPKNGLTSDQVFSRLEELRQKDVSWRDGKAFSLVYSAGPEVQSLAEEAYRRFSGENALNTEAFPSLHRIQQDVIAIVGQWLGASPECAGYMTSGGTESLLMAVKSVRDRFRVERHITTPNIVLPTSAHAAFDKACAYFDLEIRRVDVGSDWRADANAMRHRVDRNTVLVVASAPQYPQGVVDDVTAIAEIATTNGISCHVDACMGGVTLAYLDRLGEKIAPWNFAVPGVSSISVDLHKFGYTAKGASVIMYASKHLRSFQGFSTDKWLGGVYGSSGILGTKSGGAMAAAWAVLNHLGDDGYLRLTDQARQATLQLAKAISKNPNYELRAWPDSTIICFGAKDPTSLNVYAVADALRIYGWYVDRQGPPDSLHCTVNAIHHQKIEQFVTDLENSTRDVLASQTSGVKGNYGTID